MTITVFHAIGINILFFIAVVFILRKMMYSASVEEVSRLQKLRDENVNRARELQSKIEQANMEARQTIQSAQQEVVEIKEQARKDIEKVKEQVLEQARLESEKIVQAAIRSKESMQEEIARRMKGEAQALALDIFKDTISVSARQIIHQELLSDLSEALKKIPKERFDIKVDKLELSSAFPLKKGEKDALCFSILEKLGRPIPCEDKEDGNLVAGVIIKLGTFVIDATLNNRAREILVEKKKR